MILVLASSFGAPLASVPVVAETASIDGALGQRVAVIQRYFDAATRGDADGALAIFADNAVFLGARADGNCSQQAPCTDRAGLSQALQGNVAQHPCFTVRQLEVTGTIVSGRLEIRADPYPGLGIERTVLSFVAVVPHDKISLLTMLAFVM